MEMRFKIKLFIVLNFFLWIILYFIPIDTPMLQNICIIKRITGNRCFNCGMTRAFLSILHFDFRTAYAYNARVIIVFPITIMLYLYHWYQYIKREEGSSK